MSTKRDSPRLIRRNSLDALCCESCSSSDCELLACKSCLSFCCTPCSQNRSCPLQGQPCLFQKIDSEVMLHPQSHKRLNETSKTRFYDSNNRIQLGRTCQRCFISSATKECRTCRLRNYCDSCFAIVHSRKLADHEAVDLRPREKNIGSEKIEVKVKVRSINSINGSVNRNGGVNSQREEEICALQNNLNFLKNSLQQERARQENEVTQCINTISSELQALIQEVKLKIIQISLKIKDSNAQGEVFYYQRKEMLNQQERCLANLKTIAKQQSTLTNSILQGKTKSCSKVLSQYIFNQEWALNFNKDLMEKRCYDITEDIEQIKSRIVRIDLRKTGNFLDTPKHSTTGNVTSRQSKSDIKSMKVSLNCNPNKSNDKPNSLTLSLVTPKNSASNGPRASKDSESGAAKSLFSSQTGAQTSQDVIKEYLQGGSSKKNIQKPLQFASDKKPLKLPFVSPKNSTKRFDRNPEKITIAKTGNIDKAKKTLKDIRSEMRQFTIRLNSEANDTESDKRSQASLGRNGLKKV